MIKLIKVLDEDNLKKCIELVDSLKEYYEPLPEGYNFETLGAASYLHYGNEHDNNEKTGERYHSIKNKTNPILMKNFEWLYNILVDKISEELKQPCKISNEADLAFPGFHIFYPYQNCEEVCHPAHLDYQWMYHLDFLQEKFNNVNDFEFLTFTLSIKLPQNGAGLYYWDLPNDNKQYSFAEAEKLVKNTLDLANDLFANSNGSVCKEEYEKVTNPSILKYQEGYMTMFTQPILHQIMPFNNGWNENDKRVTLQGHGIKCDDIWRLYF